MICLWGVRARRSCALACVLISSRRLVSQFDERLMQLHAIVQDARIESQQTVNFARSPAAAPWWVGADKRHSQPSGTTLVDELKARPRARGSGRQDSSCMSSRVPEASEEGTPLVEVEQSPTAPPTAF